MRVNRLYGVEIFGGIAFALVFLSLSYIALSEGHITTGDPRTGLIHFASGRNAVFLGLFFLAMGLAAIGYLLRLSVFKPLVWILSALIWVGTSVWYLW